MKKQSHAERKTIFLKECAIEKELETPSTILI